LNKIDKLFDDVPVRIGTDSLKWAKYESRDIIPLWVADMDFRSPPSVVTVAQDLSSTGILATGFAHQHCIRRFQYAVKVSMVGRLMRTGSIGCPEWFVA
jgi:bifunctional pyridoxal-dependent enzyme with beta-cystathionase and maltose regulon repressor activities